MDVIDTWKQFISGDDCAYASLYEAYVQILYQYGLCFTSDTELIKDCIQDLFVYLYTNRNQLNQDCNVKAYLLVSLKHNLCKSLARLDYNDSMPEELPFLSEMSVEDRFIVGETHANNSRQVRQMLSILTPRQREILYYRYIQELPLEEICRLMDLNYQSAQNLIQRSLKKLRDTYGCWFILFYFSPSFKLLLMKF